jgi:dihydrosphingosine 1-phosphate phosphatase
MGMGVTSESASPVAVTTPELGKTSNPLDEEELQEVQETDLFAHLQKPRVRYDVEVITKLIVYCGIAWWACEGNPLVFEAIGLGLR